MYNPEESANIHLTGGRDSSNAFRSLVSGFYPLEELEASEEGPDVAPPQQRPPDDWQVVQRPLMVLGGFDQVGGGFGGSDVIDGGQHPHAQARQQPRPLSIKHEHVTVSAVRKPRDASENVLYLSYFY